MFGQSWGCLSESEVEEMYKGVCQKLKEKPFGPFDTLCLLIGDKNARAFCSRDRLDLATRPRTMGREGQ